MASDALADVERSRKEMQKEYGGKMSNQFVDEVKNSALFQFSWGELLSASPTALTLMGSLWIAASSPVAENISLKGSMPTGGFQYLVKRDNPTLRSCLVDVCTNGGREAFTTAAANMNGLEIRSRRICEERIDVVFKRLGPCTKDKYALQDFMDALEEFSEEAKQCAVLATETRVAFSKWGKMVGELHACTEQESGATSQKREAVKVDQAVANIEQKFAKVAAEDSKTQAEAMKKQLDKAEKRLDNALENVPGPWAQVAQGALTGFAQALPSIVAGVLPAVLAAANPAYGISQAAGAAAKQGANVTAQAVADQVAAKGTADTAAANAPSVPTTAADPAYGAALGIKELTTHFYEYLGGEKGKFDMSKFKEPESTGAAETAEPAEKPQSDSSVSYLIGSLKSQKDAIDVTNTEPNKKLHLAFDRLIKTANSIRTEISNANNIKSGEVKQEIVDKWKKDVKTSLNDILSLSASAAAMSSTNVPGLVKINLPKPDTSAQVAQVNSAMQAVQMTQNAVDAAQENYDAALARQAKTAAAMAEVEKRLQRLKESAATLDEIKMVLRDCINVLVDLSVQVGKLERFFTMLTTVIDHVVIPRAQTFVKEMSKAGTRANERGMVKVDDIAKQTIYTSTLQVKAYFSLLQDISGMYSQVDREYIKYGIELCTRLGMKAASNDEMSGMQEELKKYSEASAKKVAELVDNKQKEILKGLRARANQAMESTQILEDTIQARGIVISEDSRNAIKAGADVVKAEAKEMIIQEECATGTEDMAIDDL
ncbi:hypothetical protein N7528_008220 [Penicillium herquei]|nr:hypothetical protein N7528_008220 [Penicillium herquei]